MVAQSLFGKIMTEEDHVDTDKEINSKSFNYKRVHLTRKCDYAISAASGSTKNGM